MKKWFRKLWKEESGQAMTEYGLLVGLIAIVVMVVLVVLGPQLAALFQQIVDALPAAPTTP
ncbi:Flp family type IVb pilin [Sporosarcina sp. Marseille-Q4943]|uniref:Flp family type IVb pilin n=1 Tax=Sporosarcina sp. Marseille-Q4943 TaxID=2942204 RepID=UPI00208DB8D9|nr:Flp family type IVb pilin [Sporosarcina sp. Marseille-Q4943]